MSLPSITPFLQNKKASRMGLLPVMLRIIYDRKIYYKSTGVLVDPAKFTTEKLIASTEDNAAYKNRIIKKFISDYELIFLRLQENGILNKLTVEDAVKSQNESITFERMAEIVISRFGSTMTPGTVKQMIYEASKVKKFRSGITVGQMTNSFFLEYEKYMREDLKNETNTVRKTMVKLKSFFNKAIVLDLIDKNPIATYRMPQYNQPEREIISKEHQKAIENFADTHENEYLRNVAAWFVLQFYCGVRYEDLRQWGILAKVVGEKLMVIDNKTKTPHYVPMYPALRKAIKRVETTGRIPTLQAYNRSLKEIVGILNIPISLTTHMARHTFAVNFLNKGGSMLVLSKLLGHKDLKTTSIYGQITDERINKESKFLG